MNKNLLVLVISLPILFSACTKKSATDSTSTSTTSTTEEIGQQIGDTMASIDESGGSSSGTLSMMKRDERTFARLAPESLKRPLFSMFVPEAEATTCAAAGAGTFGACTVNGGLGSITRSFGGCTIGAATLTGDIVLTFARTDCAMTNTPGNYVSRTPGYVVTGLRGATLTVSKTGTFGQFITYLGSGKFRFDNDGIRRVFASNGTTLLDFTTSTSADNTHFLVINGTGGRNGRILNDVGTSSGGALIVTNNLTSNTCTLTPAAVTWNNTCNCAVSGTWTGTCTSGSTSTITLTGCGTADVSIDGATAIPVTMDRCY